MIPGRVWVPRNASADRRPQCGGLAHSVRPLGPPADPTTGLRFRSLRRRCVPQRTQRPDCVSGACDAVGSPSGPNDRIAFPEPATPLGPPADPTTECFPEPATPLSPPADPTTSLRPHKTLAEAGAAPRAGVPGCAGTVREARWIRRGGAGQRATPRALKALVAWWAKREGKTGRRNTGSGRCRPLGIS